MGRAGHGACKQSGWRVPTGRGKDAALSCSDFDDPVRERLIAEMQMKYRKY